MEVKIHAQPLESSEAKEKKYGKYDDWEIESAARTLIEAEEIKKDKEKMKYVGECLKAKGDAYSAAITSLDDLRKLANKKS
jgi:hypothetical protein